MRTGILLFAAFAVLYTPAARAAPCYVAYVHGKLSSTPGSGRSNLAPGSGATDTDRRNYWRHGPNDTYGDFVLYSGIARGCAVLVTGYDGAAAFWDAGAAGAVTQQINAFVAQNAVPDGQLVLAGHSMGWLGERTDATCWLRTFQLEYASASGSWMGDAGRFRTMYTIATRRWSNGQWVQGARRDWVRMDYDHHHARLDDQSLPLRDNVRGVDTSYFPGSYVGSFGLALQ